MQLIFFFFSIKLRPWTEWRVSRRLVITRREEQKRRQWDDDRQWPIQSWIQGGNATQQLLPWQWSDTYDINRGVQSEEGTIGGGARCLKWALLMWEQKKTYNDWMFAVKYDKLSSRNQGRDSWERHRDTGLILKTQHVSSLQRPQGWTQIRRTGNCGHTEKKGSSQNYFLIKKKQ